MEEYKFVQTEQRCSYIRLTHHALVKAPTTSLGDLDDGQSTVKVVNDSTGK